MPLNKLLAECRERAEAKLDACLPGDKIHPARLHEAMRYAALAGGKRVRAALVYLAGKALGVEWAALDAPACAVELIHAYSLAHDDLPAMDNDDLRRGKPSCHKAFDEATAILVGDALQTLAFQAISQPSGGNHINAQRRLEMAHVLALAAGSRGMAGGQMLDMLAEGQQLSLAELENLHIHKTGALIRASVKLGALSSPVLGEEHLQRLDHYAKCIGLAFQIQDDVLDIESSTEMLGKTQGSDQRNAKSTYPELLGLAGAKQMAKELAQEAVDALAGFDQRADPLRWMASYIVSRRQ